MKDNKVMKKWRIKIKMMWTIRVREPVRNIRRKVGGGEISLLVKVINPLLTLL